jgi:Uma2 family endonuclease
MGPVYVPHAHMRSAVADALEEALEPLALSAIQGVTVKFICFQPNPDVIGYVWPHQPKQIMAEDVCLIIEVSDSTLEDDLADKKARYAAAGLAELGGGYAQSPSLAVS